MGGREAGKGVVDEVDWTGVCWLQSTVPSESLSLKVVLVFIRL